MTFRSLSHQTPFKPIDAFAELSIGSTAKNTCALVIGSSLVVAAIPFSQNEGRLHRNRR